jgi:hypothetical protein
VRRLMIVVALIAVVSGSFRLKRRSEEFRQRAAKHEWLSKPGGGSMMGPPEVWMGELEVFQRYHDGMRRKYEYAAWHPWLSIEPDPPPPRVSLIVQ